MRSFAKVAIVGFTGVVLFKLFASIIFPLLILMAGLVALAVKLALLAAVAYFLYSLLRKPRRVSQDGEIVVENDEDETADDGG
jgi:Ca2+/Na+ antiporter